MKTLTRLVVAPLVVTTCFFANAGWAQQSLPASTKTFPLESQQNAYEVESIVLSFNANNQVNSVVLKECASCVPLKFDASPETALFVGNARISALEAKDLSGKAGTVLVNLKSRLVDDVIFFAN